MEIDLSNTQKKFIFEAIAVQGGVIDYSLSHEDFEDFWGMSKEKLREEINFIAYKIRKAEDSE